MRLLRRFFPARWRKEVSGAYDLAYYFSRVKVVGAPITRTSRDPQAFLDVLKQDLDRIRDVR